MVNKLHVVALLVALGAVTRSQTKPPASEARGTRVGIQREMLRTSAGTSQSNEMSRNLTADGRGDSHAGGGSSASSGNVDLPAVPLVGRESRPTIKAVDISLPRKNASVSRGAPAAILSETYRLGTGDVVNIRILNASNHESESYTVGAGGMLEYPLAGDPFKIAGMTTEEVVQQLAIRIKLYDSPKVVVSVKEYASHDVFVTGLVNQPGPVVLRREAVPLYVILAESRPLAEAGEAIVMRPGGERRTILLSEISALEYPVSSGDIVVVSESRTKEPEHFYIAGAVVSRGEKDFHKGLRLSGAIRASGGLLPRGDGVGRIFRADDRGFLVGKEYVLEKVESGVITDPEIQQGDRIEIGNVRW